MNAIKVDAMIDEAIVKAIPALSPLLGRNVELIALDAADAPLPSRKVTVDELLGSRLKPPVGVGAVSQDDIDRAIAAGVLRR